jgi:hypothetical protein
MKRFEIKKQNILVMYIIILLVQDKYNFYYPTIPVYPNNHDELEVVKEMIGVRTEDDVKLFLKTDISVCYLFVDHTTETISELRSTTNSHRILIFVKFFKNLINRARPYQIDESIDDLKSVTSHTPAYPAGHAFQAYYLARVLSIRYPDKKDKWDSLAKQCDLVRVKAGLHYPSDGAFSKKLVDYFFDFLYDSK